MWTFWPVVVTAFLAAFSLGPLQVRNGCNAPRAKGLVCRTSEIAPGPLDLDTVRKTEEHILNDTMIKGAAIEELEWKEPGTNERARENRYPFSVGIVEYDDQGREWSGQQVDAVKKLVTDTLDASDALIVTFVHGWKNNCSTCNGNLACFRETLALLSAVEDDLGPWVGGRPRPVIGIYIGWRGKTMRIPVADSISAFSRKATADQVGGRTSDLTSFLSWLNEKKVRANDQAKSAASTSVSPRLTSPLGTRLVLVGHSFGADVLFGAIAGHLNAQLGASEAYLKAQAGIPEAAGQGLAAKPMGDLAVLVNPALEASAYHRFAADAGRTFRKGQLPLLITVQATNDQVTRVVFPIERALISLPGSTATREDYGSSLSTIGHFSPYFTHTLCQPGKPGCSPASTTVGPEALQRLGLPLKEVAKQEGTPRGNTPCGCDRFEASRDFHAIMLRTLRASLRQPAGYEHIGESMRPGATDFEPLNAQINVDSPFLVVRATPDVVDKHSGIYRPQFFDFLTNMLVREQLLETPGVRERARERVQSE